MLVDGQGMTLRDALNATRDLDRALSHAAARLARTAHAWAELDPAVRVEIGEKAPALADELVRTANEYTQWEPLTEAPR